MNERLAPQVIVHQMMDNDAFSQWMKIKIHTIEEGRVKLSMTITEEMTNGFGIAHGGILYSFADSALAFASNSFGYQAVSFDTSIKHLRSGKTGMHIYAETEMIHKSQSLCHMHVKITDEEQHLLALFTGTCKTSRVLWELPSP